MNDTGRWIVGCMTGTSLDALDVALVKVVGHRTQLHAQLHGFRTKPLDELRGSLHALASGTPQRPVAYLRTARAFGEFHSQTIDTLCRAHLPPTAKLAFIAAHGQTICHVPKEQLMWQLLDPWPMVRALGVPVVFDMRQADVVAGGQGAPITPLADWILFHDATRSRAVVNLGGICNVTVLSAVVSDAVAGGDVGPCNLLLDGLTQRLFGEPYDADARRARTGRVDATCVHQLDQRITRAMEGASTLGREQFTSAWLDAVVRELGEGIGAADLLASAIEAVAKRVASSAWCESVDEFIVAGGGAKNPLLLETLTRHAQPRVVRTSDALHVPAEAREAMAMAVLGALCHDGVPITLDGVTGARCPGVAGSWAGLHANLSESAHGRP